MTRVHSDSRNLPLADWEFLLLGTICLLRYLDTEFEDHENPALAAIFIEAIPQVVEILHAFQHTHPIIDHVDKYFANKPVQARRQKLAEWMAAFGLVSTPELDAVLQPVLEVLLVHAHLADLPESDRNERVMGVGSALLQLLAGQDQLKEPLNLNGDLLNDLLDGRVVHCPSDGDRSLDAMFASIPLPRRAEHSRTLAPAPASPEEQHSELEDKIVKEVIREFPKGGMYFAYTFVTTTRPLSLVEPNPTLPLWRRVDRKFWWNEWMSKPFIDAGVHPYVLPIMQGYYQISKFTIPPDPLTHDEDTEVDYIIVSRRSRDRAGLRYQRRGIDDDAHVANFVETETIMRVEREVVLLFWTQAGYGLKPPPLLATDRTHEQHMDALKRHFERTVPKYGPHDYRQPCRAAWKEASVTQGYREFMAELADKNAVYHEYDFHMETKG
ncbi:SacI homology domain-containing protein [Mycena rosella]|uniref:SacI homology domain-containing protein n=1 Tax=Mycena rosella TaxID=1033263 RepID=A0AAD7CT41_MYCRO|nr:SacI homology domain-containing protein [Mycena rosella]